jgi:hypothetical protein
MFHNGFLAPNPDDIRRLFGAVQDSSPRDVRLYKSEPWDFSFFRDWQDPTSRAPSLRYPLIFNARFQDASSGLGPPRRYLAHCNSPQRAPECAQLLQQPENLLQRACWRVLELRQRSK